MSPELSATMQGRFVALLRGINVGRAARVSMADLKVLFGELGYSRVETVLNSGNVVFGADSADTTALAATIEAAVAARLGVRAGVLVVSAGQLARIVADNPLQPLADNPSRLLVAFVADASALAELEPLMQRDWTPEVLARGSLAAYLWCADGVSDSVLAKEVGKALRSTTLTTRNWTTTVKLAHLAG